jgi:N-acetylmuramoyl-L-alanine amidase
MKQTQHRFPVATCRHLGAMRFLLGLLLLTAIASRADDLTQRRASAHDQFARAEALRADLEAKPERQRSIKDYQQLVSAYRRVYLITPNAVEVPGALKQVGDLYRTMGEQFEPMYFDSAVETYEYLVHEYPASSLREEAQLAVAKIQADNLGQADLAKQSYQEFLSQHPRSEHAAQVRKTLAEIAAAGNGGAAAAGAAVASHLAPAPPPASAAAPGRSTAPPDTADVGQIRVWNADTYTRIIIPLGGQAKYQAARISDPDRIYFDISGAKLGAKLNAPVDVPSGGYLKAVRMAQNNPDVVRIVLEVTEVKDYSVFELANPDRLVVDVYGPDADIARGASSSTAKRSPMDAPLTANKPAAVGSATDIADTSTEPRKTTKNSSAALSARADAPNLSATSTAPNSSAAASAAASKTVKNAPAVSARAGSASVNANAPSTVSGAAPTGSSAGASAPAASLREVKATKPTSIPAASANSATGASLKTATEVTGPAPVPQPTSSGEQSLTRALGLKIGRIVIDAGHGGHDTGTIGPTGLMEKDLALDLALRLGKLIETRLPAAEVIYTRSEDTFVPLEQRTAIANNSKADLFLSIHANSSTDPQIGGIETYYLNFNASPGAMDVAARENATAQSNVHDLDDIVQKIARNEKIEESRDFASDIQASLAKQAGATERSRGVRRAPFVVLIGADMPSVLAEVSFLSNPAQEQWLKKPDNRQRIAEGLYRGIETYLHSTNSLATAAAPPPTAQPMAVARSDGR